MRDEGSSPLEQIGVLSLVVVVLAGVLLAVQGSEQAVVEGTGRLVCRVLDGGDCPSGEAAAVGPTGGATATAPSPVTDDRPTGTGPPQGLRVQQFSAPGDQGARGPLRARTLAARTSSASPGAGTAGHRAYPTTDDTTDHYGQGGRRSFGTVPITIPGHATPDGVQATSSTQARFCVGDQVTRVGGSSVQAEASTILCQDGAGLVHRCQLEPSARSFTCSTTQIPSDLVVCQPQVRADDVVQCRYRFPPEGSQSSVLRCQVVARAGGVTAAPTRYTCTDTENDATGAAPVDDVNTTRRCVGDANDPLGAEICEDGGQLYRCVHTGSGTSDPATNPVESCSTRALGVGALKGCTFPEDDSVVCPFDGALVRCYTPAANDPDGAEAAGKWGLFNCQLVDGSLLPDSCLPQAPGRQASRRPQALEGGCSPGEVSAPGTSALATNPHVVTDRPLPHRTYRGDARPPSQIFRDGLTARDTGYDLETHVQGGTASMGSGFISTSELEDVAGTFARSSAYTTAVTDGQATVSPTTCPSGSSAAATTALLCVTPGTSQADQTSCVAAVAAAIAQAYLCSRGQLQRFQTGTAYIYVIDPEVAANMLHVPSQADPRRTLARYGGQAEWAAVHHIPPTAVVGAFPVTANVPAVGVGAVSATAVPGYARGAFIPNPGYRPGTRDDSWRDGSGWTDETTIIR